MAAVPPGFGRWPSARQWKPTNADSVVTENDDRARREVVGNWHKVGLDDCELVGRPASGELPDQQDRWPRGAGAG